MRKYYKKPPSSFDSTFFVFIFLVLGIGFGLNQLIPFNFANLQIYIFTLAGSVVILGGGLMYLIYEKERRRLKALALSDIDNMTGVEFEHYVVELLKFQNYAIEHTGKTGDYGTDAVARKNGDRISVQIKRYTKTVNADAIRQAFTAMSAYNCNKAMVVTNNFFTREAKKLAEWNNVILIDRNIVTDWIVAFQKGK